MTLCDCIDCYVFRAVQRARLSRRGLIPLYTPVTATRDAVAGGSTPEVTR